MRKSNRKCAFIFILSVLLMWGCKYKEDPSTPSVVRYVTASEDFEVISQSISVQDAGSINFAEDSLFFAAEFNEEVSWSIIITGLSHPSDHAERIITGTSSEILPEDVFWDGASDNLYFFKRNEVLTIRLEILGREDVVYSFGDGITVSGTKKFNNNVILDFETIESAGIISDPASVFMFFDTENRTEYLDTAKFLGTGYVSNKGVALPTPIEGDGLIYMRGIDLVGEPNSFFIGGFNHSPSLYGLDAPVDSIYINMYVSSFGNTTTKMIIEFDGLGGDTFKSEKFITWEGWRLVSVKLSDFVLGNAGALGTGILTPKFLKKLAVQIHSGDGAAKEAEILVDYINFTYGTPFRQSN